MGFPSLAIWKQAISFHLTYLKSLLPVLPLLCLPVVGDALHSLLISQKLRGGNFFPGLAARQVWRFLPSLLAMKLYFEGAALLWGLIPIYGIIQGIKHRMCWGMASNVLVFEMLSGEAGRNRCRELIKVFARLGIRTLVIVPLLLGTGCLLVWVIGTTLFETSYWFWAYITAIFWIIIPGSGAVNTFLYLEMIRCSVGPPTEVGVGEGRVGRDAAEGS